MGKPQPQFNFKPPTLTNGRIDTIDQLQSALRWLGYAPSAESSSLFAGKVTSSGSADVPFPAGWSVSRVGTGQYTITHNLGTTDIAVLATPLSIPFQCKPANFTANTVDILTQEQTGSITWAASDVAFCFLISK